MFLSAILVSFFALMVHAIPLSPQKPADVACTDPGDCYVIQSLNVSLPSGSEEQVQLTFTLWDDAQSSNNKTVCSTSWEAGTEGWPQNYVRRRARASLCTINGFFNAEPCRSSATTTCSSGNSRSSTASPTGVWRPHTTLGSEGTYLCLSYP